MKEENRLKVEEVNRYRTEGKSMEEACQLANVNGSSYYAWNKQLENPFFSNGRAPRKAAPKTKPVSHQVIHVQPEKFQLDKVKFLLKLVLEEIDRSS